MGICSSARECICPADVPWSREELPDGPPWKSVAAYRKNIWTFVDNFSWGGTGEQSKLYKYQKVLLGTFIPLRRN